MSEAKQHFPDDVPDKEPESVSPLHLTPELREWARSLDTEEEIVAGLQEAREQNGPELKEAIRRLEQKLRVLE